MIGNMKKWMFAVLVFSLLLGACEKELPDNKSGKEVLVRVRLVGVSEGGEEDLTRSDSKKESKIVSTSIGDGMLLEMQMERDTSALRATKTQLASNSLFRVVALKHNTTTFISYGDFTITDGPVAGNLHVPINDSYDFVCYSYNSTTLPAAPTQKQGENISTTIDVLQGAKDLLWTKIKEDVTDEAPELEILLRRTMARMKVVLDVSYNKWMITGIGDIMLESVNSGGTVQLTDGTVAGAGTPTFTSWSGSGYQQESNELLVMPKASGSTITVSIPKDAIARQSLSAVPANAATATFIAELKAGYSYRLLVRLRTPIFARSNIYWEWTTDKDHPEDGGKLTFVSAADDPAQNDDTNAGYQGVFFKWGSLVGISPVGNFSGSTDIYVPVIEDPLTVSTWDPTTATARGWTSWGYTIANPTDIPYMDPDRGSGTTGRDNTWLIDEERNVLDTIKGFRGDICQYLGKTQTALDGYRLPTSNEFGLSNNTYEWISGGTSSDGWVRASSFLLQSTSDVDGTANIIGSFSPPTQSFGKNTSMDGVIFPASGYLDKGSLSLVGYYGYYWSGSAYSTESGHLLFYDAHDMGPNGAMYRSAAFPIRCVKKVDPNGNY
jgi:hypothetical protein